MNSPPALWSPSPIPRDLTLSFSAATIMSPAKQRPAPQLFFATVGVVATVDGRLGTVRISPGSRFPCPLG
jgi:hypothetical protein